MIESNENGQQVTTDLAEFLKNVRKSTGMTQREVAKKSGLSHTYIAQLEKNLSRRLRLATIAQLAEGYGVSLEAMSRAAGVEFPDIDEKQLMDRLNWAFDAVCKDPTVPFSMAVGELYKKDAVLKAYIVGIYIRKERRRLLKPEEWSAIVAYVEQHLLTKQSVSDPATPDPATPDPATPDPNRPRRRIQTDPTATDPTATDPKRLRRIQNNP